MRKLSAIAPLSRPRAPPYLFQNGGCRAFGAVTPLTEEEGPPFVPYASQAPRVHSSPLVDTFGRMHSYLRISLTDKCNMRCQYCIPEEGEEPILPNATGQLLTREELRRLLHLMVGLGVRKVRLTGGEPTIRGDFAQIVEDLGQLSHGLSQPLSLGITTNGVRLSKYLPNLQRAGLRGINLSLDTLVSAKWPLLTRRPKAWHERVLKALKEVASMEEDFSLKVNCVLLRGVNEDEIGQFMDLTEHHRIEVRFLEFMPFDSNGWAKNRLVPQAEILDSIQRHVEQRGLGKAERLPPDSISDVARLWQVPGWRGRVGIISSMTNAFCGGCNRLRFTADGELRNCLFGEEGWSVRDAMRAGASDDDLTAVIAKGVRSKYGKLGGKRDMHELHERGGHALRMMSLGG